MSRPATTVWPPRGGNYRYSTNLQVAVDAHTHLVVALGDPQPGNRNDTIVYRTSGIDQKLAGRPVIADGAYRGNPDVITPYRKPADGSARKGRTCGAEYCRIRRWGENSGAL
uniref:Transposase IS4 family protein n=1 Tax=Salinispora arenicola (strain CNS-205) TaxID=391037 RepID=A8M7H3_SALAI